MTLRKYRDKRKFDETPEPSAVAGKSTSKLTFVVQRHDASHLHYDFRLEMDGVLKSWAIPKGPSLNPGDKRLAVMVEDHPVEYGKFTGVIPKGNYGAGTVEIWDKGTYKPEATAKNPEAEILKELEAGSLKFILDGQQLRGSFALVALKKPAGESGATHKNWLLIKHRDEFAEDEFDIEDHPPISLKKKDRPLPFASSPVSVRAVHEKVNGFIPPMLATLGDKPFDSPDWVFEIKWDGYRAVSEVSKADVKLYSRNGISFVSLYPSVVSALKKIKHAVVLDGEVVALDAKGVPSFQNLQNQGLRRSDLVYYVFDCLNVDGKDLTGLPLLKRKEYLTKIIPKDSIIRISDHVESEGVTFFGKVVERGLEGMIAKRNDSVYQTGKRSRDWVKIKNQNTQEAVIAGFTAPRNSRKYFGALVLGVFKGKKFHFIGHTGTGFTEKNLKEVYDQLKPLTREESPFEEKIPMKEKVTWCQPVKVCSVKYSEITKDGILRHPVFMGLRIDKAAREVDSVDKPVDSGIKRKAEAKAKASTAIETSKTKPSRLKSPLPAKGSQVVKSGKNEVIVSNPGKIFWPDEKITKLDVVEYYRSISKYILPYLKNRPQSLKRTPNGITDRGFFHKDAAAHAPEFAEHISLYSESARKDIDYILCNNEATLLYLNNLGCIEINPWNSMVDSLDNPDYLIMDIDPSDKNTFDEVIETALTIKEILETAGAKGYPKTSGATGMHIYIPLHARYDYDPARMFAEAIATMVVDRLPRFTTTERSLAKRGNKIYVDYLQNKRGQTLSSAYSLRPVPGATVSTPLEWKEVKHGLLPAKFTIYNTLDRLKKKGDIFAPVLKEKIDLEKCISRLGF